MTTKKQNLTKALEFLQVYLSSSYLWMNNKKMMAGFDLKFYYLQDLILKRVFY